MKKSFACMLMSIFVWQILCSAQLKATENENSIIEIAKKLEGTKDKNVRKELLLKLSETKPSNKIEFGTIVDLIKNKEQDIKEAAAQSLSKITSADKQIEPHLVKLLTNKDSLTSAVAMIQCGEIKSEKALPIMLKKLKTLNMYKLSENDSFVYQSLISGLGKYGNKVIPYIIEMVHKSSNEEEKKTIARVISQINDREATLSLLKIAEDDNQYLEMRTNALFAIGDIDSSKYLNELIILYENDKKDLIRGYVLDCIGNSKKKDAIQFLKKIVKNDTNDINRMGSLSALAKIQGEEAVPFLLEVYHTDKSSGVKDSAEYLLRKLTGKDYDWRSKDEK